MIIKIIREEGDGDNIKEIEHYNVKEFFISGLKKNIDDETIDFHDWNGSYRYLIGDLAYFNEVICDKYRRSNDTAFVSQLNDNDEKDNNQKGSGKVLEFKPDEENAIKDVEKAEVDEENIDN